jgi:hypothetical protein
MTFIIHGFQVSVVSDVPYLTSVSSHLLKIPIPFGM